MALEGDQVCLEKLFVDKSDKTVTFPNCPNVASLFFQPWRSSTIKLDKSIDEKVQEHVYRYDEYLPWAQRGLALYGREKEGRSLVYVYVFVKLEDVWLNDLMT